MDEAQFEDIAKRYRDRLFAIAFQYTKSAADADGMAQCISDLVANVAAGKDLMDGIADKYTVDEGVNKIRIPYQIYLGE